jgi:CubicO group peptidase (beta-lactamase class C family)
MTYKIYINCLKASFIAISLLFFQPLLAQKDLTAITQLLESRRQVLGQNVAVLVSGKDSLLYQKEWGDMKLKTVAPVGSASSWLTAALVLQFVDEGKLSLDDKVVKYLPVFEKYGKNYITLRHCLTHQTGIQDRGGKITRLIDRRRYASLEEQAADYASKEIETNPGTAFSYSNMGLIIASRVLEVVGKKRFDLLIKQKLLTPLGMRQTSFSTTDASAPDAAEGAKSTAADYMAFLKMLLNGGKHNGQQVLSEAAVVQMRTLHAINLPQYNIPKAVAAYPFAFGAWAVEAKGDKATVLAGPSFTGTWPAVDFCRGYTVLLFVKERLNEPRAEVYGDLKKLIDPQFASGCK